MKLQTERGTVTVDTDVFTSISGWVAAGCFGVKGMAFRSISDGIVHVLNRNSVSKGVKVTKTSSGSVHIALHIAVEHGVNIPVVCRSIIGEVTYNVEKWTGVTVDGVDVYVDAIFQHTSSPDAHKNRKK